jgi:hypothetical protein
MASESWLAAFAAGCGPMTAALAMLIPLGGSLFYFSFLGWWQLVIPACTIPLAIAEGLGLCRLNKGLDRRVLLGANVATQLTFLLAYLAARNLAL